jgi:hypothetical protein
MFSNTARRLAAKQVMGGTYPMRYFGVLPKLPKIELTLRTPYGTMFKDFAGFTRVYAGTTKGQIAIGNKTIPRVYLLPPGQIKVAGLGEGEGKITKSESGEFIHTGGWLFVHDNNSIEVNLLECVERENFMWDKLDSSVETETHSSAGRIGATLQEKTVKLLSRRR